MKLSRGGPCSVNTVAREWLRRPVDGREMANNRILPDQTYATELLICSLLVFGYLAHLYRLLNTSQSAPKLQLWTLCAYFK